MRVPNRRLTFSLRTLLVLVGLLCSWLAYERSVVLERRAARKVMAKTVILFSPAEIERGERLCPTGQPASIPAKVPWIRGLLGDEPIQEFWFPFEGSAAEQDAARLFPEATIRRF